MSALVGLVTASGLPVSAAAAEPTEILYLLHLQENGISNYGGSDSALIAGRAMCSEMAAGAEPVTVALDVMTRTGMEMRTSYILVDIAAADLCPELGKSIGIRRN